MLKILLLFMAIGVAIISVFFTGLVKLDANSDVKTIIGLLLSVHMFLLAEVEGLKEKK